MAGPDNLWNNLEHIEQMLKTLWPPKDRACSYVERGGANAQVNVP